MNKTKKINQKKKKKKKKKKCICKDLEIKLTKLTLIM